MKRLIIQFSSLIILASFIIINPFVPPSSTINANSSKYNEQSIASGQTLRVSVASNGIEANGGMSLGPSISDDGRYIAFQSLANNLVSEDTNWVPDIFVKDLQTGHTERTSVASDGTQANEWSSEPTISDDGRYVAFSSTASNLVSGDTNNFCYYESQLDGSCNDIFVHDRQTGHTELVSEASDGTQGNDWSTLPSISDDGRFVVFVSRASNLVSGDTNNFCDNDNDNQFFDNCSDIFVHDRQTSQTQRVSVSSSGTQGNNWSSYPSISGDGRYVAFHSMASNIVSEDTNWGLDIFIHDRQTGQTQRVSVASDGTQGNGWSWVPSISADGHFVSFYSHASNLVDGDSNGVADVFVKDIQTGNTHRVSLSSNSVQGNDVSTSPSISADGRYVAFVSRASNLVSGDTNNFCDHDNDNQFDDNCNDIFVHDRQTGQTQRVSVSSNGTQGNDLSGLSGDPSISADGRIVAFSSLANNLVCGDTNDEVDVFVHDRTAQPNLDTCFRPKPDGYEFCNGPDPNGHPCDRGWDDENDFDQNAMIEMFGQEDVCATLIGSTCIPRLSALIYEEYINRALSAGHCEGMASTSLLFYSDNNQQDFQDGATNTFSLDFTNVRRHISYHHVLQEKDEIKNQKSNSLQISLPVKLDQLRNSLSNGSNNPVLIFIRPAPGNSGHTMVPYKVLPQENGVSLVMVYDSNWPGDTNRSIFINEINETWSYDLGEAVWTGNSNTLGLVPIDLYYDKTSNCWWCEYGTLQTIRIILEGNGHLVINDSFERKIGFSGDEFVNDIPNANIIIFDGGLGIDSEPVYSLPISGSYQINIDGQAFSTTNPVGVTQFGPGYAVWAEGVTLNPSTQDEINITSDGTQISYKASEMKDVNLGFTEESDNQSKMFEIIGADIGTGDSITISNETGADQIKFANSQSMDGKYDFSMNRVNEHGKYIFFHKGIEILGTDSHFLDYSNWDGSGLMTLLVDNGSDGTIDEVLTLENHANRNYFPLVIKH